MKVVDNSQFIWSEKYRPSCIEDTIIPEDIRTKFKEFIQKERFPHLLLTSTNPGLGKTSITNAIIKDLDADVLWINGSQDRGIDVFRTRIRDFATSVSIDDSPKIIVIDEADGLSPDAQKGARGVLEEFSKHTTFIMTANYKEKIIEPLRNRFTHFDFDSIYAQNKKEMAIQIMDRLQFILNNEHIEYDRGSLGPVITNLYPSVRKMVLTLQQSISGNKLVLDSNMINLNTRFGEIMTLIRDKKFPEVKKNISILDDPSSIYTYVFKNIDLIFDIKSQPGIILLCARYQDMSENARDKMITATAFAIEIMGNASVGYINNK